MSDAKQRTDLAIQEATLAGFNVVVGDDDHLLLDLDTPVQLAHYEQQRAMARDLYGAAEVDRWNSKGGNWHVYMTLRTPLAPALRVAVQAALGSDPRRELLAVNLLLQYPNEEPALLFRPPTAKKEIELENG